MHIGYRVWGYRIWGYRIWAYRIWAGAVLGAALLAVFASGNALAQGDEKCAGLRGVTLDAAYVTSADVVGAADGMPA